MGPRSTEPAVVPPTTRELIIVAAERLFSERGVHAVSLREVGAAAGQRNSGVVQYHFGDKENLISAILEFRMRSANAERLRMLERLGDPADATLGRLLELFVLPLVGATTADGYYVRFLDQLLADPARRSGFDWGSAEGLRTVWGLIRERLGDLPPDVLEDRLTMLINMTIRTVADHEGRPARRPRPAWAANLVDAACGMLTAPVGGAAGTGRVGEADPPDRAG